MNVDAGKYNADPEHYRKLLEEMYASNPPIDLPAEYAWFLKDNTLRMLIRLARYKFVARMLRPRDRILEVGSGSGLGAVFLGQHCAAVKGIEIKQTEIDEARALNRRSNVSFSNEDFFDLPAGDKYDAIVALDVIEHFRGSTPGQFIATAARHLKPDGFLAIGTPSLYSYEYQSPLSKASHEKCYDLPELLELIGTAFGRSFPFSMNDELVHTGYHKMAWYYFVLATVPQPPAPDA
jgi:SAM-dependent methyltransferase